MVADMMDAEEIANRRSLAQLKKEIADARSAEIKARMAEQSVMSVTEAQEQIMRLANDVRAALGRSCAYLPASLSATEREACDAALRKATHEAMLSIGKADSAGPAPTTAATAAAIALEEPEPDEGDDDADT